MPVLFSAVRRFDPACGEPWQKFIDWSPLTQLREVVSLDLILCPTAFQELIAEDWQHNVHEDCDVWDIWQMKQGRKSSENANE